jgi:hypothetical protein
MKLSDHAAAVRRERDEKDDEYRTGWEEIMARAEATTPAPGGP